MLHLNIVKQKLNLNKQFLYEYSLKSINQSMNKLISQNQSERKHNISNFQLHFKDEQEIDTVTTIEVKNLYHYGLITTTKSTLFRLYF
jgi:hypothetical protein